MRIQYMSDLHMELYDNSRYIKAKEFEATGDVLVLAGDIFYLRDTQSLMVSFMRDGFWIFPPRHGR